ncbi:MAG: hypothetical protein JOY72_03815, partial [Actinobacteria bacterium]|nr:hypothetical protein [Actinomycetota bacterium]
MRLPLFLAVLVVAAGLARPAAAAPGLLLGIDDDSLKWYTQTNSLLAIYNSLGVGAVRVTFDWTDGETFPTGNDLTELQRVAAAARRIRVIVAVTGTADDPPLDDASRASYCTFVSNIVRHYPWIHDIAIWTEPNSSTFWDPQHDAAAGYEALLAACWDALHAAVPDANVIATSAPHAHAGDWYRALGKAYRASGRTLPIFDTIGHNGYANNSSEPPDAIHKTGSIDEGDLGRLMAAIKTGFGGTGQPLPGEDGVSIWYLEDGFQSEPPLAFASLYSGTETDRHPVDEEEQATQITAAVDLAYCQPEVGGFFNFELRDESTLTGWQSGLMRPDWSAKPAYFAYQAAVAAARAGTI